MPDTFVRIVASAPSLDAAALAVVRDLLGKLFTQFANEGRCGGHAVTCEADGAALIIAWDGATAEAPGGEARRADADLSGCSKDKLDQVLAHAGTRIARDLLACPPLIVQALGGACCVDRPGLRALVAAGRIDADTLIADRRVDRLAAWRTRGWLRLADSPFSASLASAPTIRPGPAASP